MSISQLKSGVLVIVTNEFAINTPFTKGKLKSSEASCDEPFASSAVLYSTGSVELKITLSATNFIVFGLGVSSA